MVVERQFFHLHLEQALEKSRGRAVGWTCAPDSERHLMRKVAEAATESGVAKLRVSEFTRWAHGSHSTAFKVYNEQGTDLSDYWNMVRDVQSQLGLRDYSEDELAAAVQRTIDDKKSGELQRRIDSERHCHISDIDFPDL